MDEFVEGVLRKHDLSKYIELFKENEIDESVFRKLTPEDLDKLLPNKVGPYRKLLNEIEDLRRSQDVEDWTTAASAHFGGTSTPDFSMQDPSKDGRGGDSSPEGVLIYIDNSNLFISTQRVAARDLKFKGGIQFDKRVRIDVGRLLTHAITGRVPLEPATLYGSEPPKLDTVWKKIREKSVAVKTFKRSQLTNKEKQIDTAIAVDATEKIVLHSSSGINGNEGLKGGGGRSVIFISGDKDMLPAIKVGRRYGWTVEIWSYLRPNNTLSHEIQAYAKKHKETIKIVDLYDIWNSYVFCATLWKINFIPVARTLVLLVDMRFSSALPPQEVSRFLDMVVHVSTAELSMPMVARLLPVFRPTTQDPSKDPIPTSNRFEALKLSDSSCQDPPTSYAAMALICLEPESQMNKEKGSHGEPKKVSAYDFQRDVHDRRDAVLESIKQLLPTHKEHGQPSCQIITYQQYQQHQAHLTELNLPDLPEDETMVDDFDEEDDPDKLDIDFQLIQKKAKRATQKFSESCTYRFRCVKGTKCTYGHSDPEKEFFKAHPNINRYKYKTALCTHNDRCKYATKPYLCPYAHGFVEYNCLVCGEIGIHYSDECPDREPPTKPYLQRRGATTLLR